jgi:hypothetical protein
MLRCFLTLPRSLKCFAGVMFLILGLPLAATAQVTQSWLMLHKEMQDTMIVIDAAERAKLEQAGWTLNGTLGFVPDNEPGGVALHRMAQYNKVNGGRIFTARSGEIKAAINLGYTDEGKLGLVGLKQLSPGMVPVQRYRKGERYIWLVDKSVQPWAEENGWRPDVISFWVRPVASP